MTFHGKPALEKLRRRKFLAPTDIAHETNGLSVHELNAGIISTLIAGAGRFTNRATLNLLEERLKIGESLYGKEHPSNSIVKDLIIAYNSDRTTFVPYLACRKCGKFYAPAAKEKVWRCGGCKSFLIIVQLPQSIQSHASEGMTEATLYLPVEVRLAFGAEARLAGKYILAKEIGRGGTSRVYLGFDLELERVVAVKLISSGNAPFEWVRSEAQVSARLDFEGVPRIHDAFVSEEGYCIVMDYIDGTNSDRMSLSTTKIISVFLDAAKIMSRAHARGIIHRDLKPSNILVDRSGNVRITDFGIAKIISEHRMRDTTQTGSLIGTPHFMSPEQATGIVSEIDARSDVFSLGATIYFLLTGRNPFQGKSVVEIAANMVSADPEPIREHCPAIPQDIEAIVFKCLERDKSRRYKSMDELAEDIEAFMGGEPVSARKLTATALLFRKLRRKKMVIAVIASLLIAIGAIATAFLTPGKSLPPRDLGNLMLLEIGDMIEDAIRLRNAGGSRRQIDPLVDRATRLYDAIGKYGIRDARVHEYLGRFYRAIGETSKSEHEFRRAIELDPRQSAAHYQLGMILFFNYREQIESLRREWRYKRSARAIQSLPDVTSGQEPQESEIADANARKTLIDSCQMMRTFMGFRLCDEERLTAESVLLWADGKCRDAECKLNEAMAYDGVRNDAAMLMSDTLLELGRCEQAAQTLSSAIERAKGNTGLLRRRAKALQLLGESAQNVGEAEGYYSKSAADIETIMKLDGELQSSILALAIIKIGWGDRRIEFGLDPNPQYESALESFKRLSASEPKEPAHRLKLAGLLLKMALHAESSGKSPAELFEKAQTEFDGAVSLSCDATSFSWRGGFWLNRAVSRASSGMQADIEFRHSAEDLNTAISISANSPDYETYMWRAALYSNWALYRQIRGKNADAEYALCLTDFEKAIELCEIQEPSCIADKYQILTWRGSMWLNRGDRKSEDDKETPEEYSKARADFEEAIKLAPGRRDAHVLLAGLLMNIGVHKMNSAANPQEYFDESESNFAKALEMNPNDVRALMWRGRLRANYGVYLDRMNMDPSDAFFAAISDFDASLETNSSSYEPLMWKGECLMNWGDYVNSCGANPFDKYAAALQALEACAKLCGSDLNLWNHLGTCRGAMIVASTAHSLPGFDVLQAYAALQADFQKAIDLRPDDGEAYLRRGMYRTVMKDHKEALMDFEIGQKLSPQLAKQFQRFIDIARDGTGDF